MTSTGVTVRKRTRLPRPGALPSRRSPTALPARASATRNAELSIGGGQKAGETAAGPARSNRAR